MEYLDQKQLTDVFRAAYKASRRDHLMLLMSFHHGLRNSEVAEIKLSDIQNGLLHVARKKNSLETTQPLQAAPRGVPFSTAILFDEVKALQAWLEERPQGTDLLFPSREGGALTRWQVNRISKKYGADHHHLFKHSVARMMLAEKKDLAFVKQALGHRAISSTIVYVHVQDSEAMQAASEALQSALSR